jgi:hypothetical protein
MVNGLLMDGSATSFQNAIDASTWRALGTRGKREVASSY